MPSSKSPGKAGAVCIRATGKKKAPIPPVTRPWHVYLIECTDGSLYAGTTTDVARRYQQHTRGSGARYTKSHPPRKLVGSKMCGTQGDALRAEAAIRRLPKTRKASFFD
jgi:putative endonuclease